MSVKRVRFLGQEECISDQLPILVRNLQRFDVYFGELIDIVLTQMKGGEYTGYSEEDFEQWLGPIRSIAGRIIQAGEDEGIYALTLSELVDQNPGVQQLREVCRQTLRGVADNLSQAMGEWMDGVSSARREAAQGITGSGVSLFTNSITSSLLYGTLEYSTLKKQCDQADKEYKETLERLRRQNTYRQQAGERRILAQVYYPGCNQAIAQIISHMLQAYLARLEEEGRFHSGEVERYSLMASGDILKNLALVKDQRRVLVEAFEHCPYNPDIYTSLVDCSFLDHESFAIAGYLGLGEGLLPALRSHIQAKAQMGLDAPEAIEIYSSFEGRGGKEAYREMYREVCERARESYLEALAASQSREACVKWIQAHLSENAMELIQKKGAIRELVREEVEKILDKDLFLKLTGFEALELKELCSLDKGELSYAALLKALQEKLSEGVLEIVEKAEERVPQMEKEMEVLEAEEKTLLEDCAALEKDFEEKLEQLRLEKGMCSFHQIIKKRKLARDIEEVTLCRDVRLQNQRRHLDNILQEKKHLRARREALS